MIVMMMGMRKIVLRGLDSIALEGERANIVGCAVVGDSVWNIHTDNSLVVLGLLAEELNSIVGEECAGLMEDVSRSVNW